MQTWEARERALQQYSREYALAHIGISSTSDASNSKPVAELVKDWGCTYHTVLTEQQKKVSVFPWGTLAIARIVIACHVIKLACMEPWLIRTSNGFQET